MPLTVHRCDACGAEFTMIEDEDLEELSCPVCLAAVDADDDDDLEDDAGVDDDAEDQGRSE